MVQGRSGSRFDRRTALWAVTAPLGLAIGVSLLADPPAAAPRPGPAPRTAAGYVSDEQCASCHLGLYLSYQHIAMARTFSRPTPENVIEDFENNRLYHEPSKRHYELTFDDGTFLMTRYQVDDEGRRVNEIEQRIDWIVGSGDHGRSYLFRNPAGELFMLPVSWYSRSQSWGMTPGFDNDQHSGLSRQVIRECIFCHNNYPDMPAGSDVFSRPHVFPTDLAEGIGCQRCHGPGEEHVRVADDPDAPLDAVRATVVNPARLPPVLRDDVCYQCHMLPSSTRTSIVRRFGRPEYSFRPGEPLTEYLVHLDFDYRDEAADRFEVDHHPYRMRQSTCFKESNGRMSCLTCHDPHVDVPAAEAAGYYRARCMTCHEIDDCRMEAMAGASSNAAGGGPAAATNNCIACHMPKRRTHDVVHVVMTDHRIVRQPRPDALAPRHEESPPAVSKVKVYWSDRPPPMADIYRAIPLANDGNRRAVNAMAAAVAGAAPRQVEPYQRLAKAQVRAERFEDAIASLAIVLEREPDSALALAETGFALSRLGNYRDALEYLTRAIEIEPLAPTAQFNLGIVTARLGRLEEARLAYEEAVHLRPTYTKAWVGLGDLHARRGRFADAAEAYRRALATEPNHPVASESLGWVLMQTGDRQEALRVWRHAASLAPDHAALALHLALAYLAPPDPSLIDAAEGLRYARAAAENGGDALAAETALALALLRNNELEAAILKADRALLRGADRATCLLIVTLAHLESGEVDAARDHFRQARQALSTAVSHVQKVLRAEAEAAFASRPQRRPHDR